MTGFSDFFGQREETERIINAHANDFNYNNASEYLKKVGGYKAYIKSLGGVFTKYADFTGTVKTISEFYDCLDYVWGLYRIWGTDYSNGCNWSWKENMYKAYDEGATRFYPNQSPERRFDMNYGCRGFANGDDLPTVDEMLSESKYYAVTNCGQGVCQGLKKAGLIPRSFGDPAYTPETYRANGYGYKLIKNASDLRPGDVLLYTQGGYIPDRASRKTLDNWTPNIAHTAIVGSRDSSYIYQFDSGHAFTYYGEPINRRRIGDVPYQWCTDWIGIRLDCIDKLERTKEGWFQESGKWFFYVNGQKTKGWKKILYKGEDCWFYFNDKGEMLTGFQKIKWSGGTDTFYFDSNGVMVTGWKQINGKWYYFESAGNMVTGLRQLKWKDRWDYYLFGSDGAMLTGKQRLTVIFNNEGHMTGGKHE